MIAGLAAVVALAAAPAAQPLPPDYPLTRPAPACPAWMTAWTLSGTLQAGDDWNAILLEVRGDRARLTELTIRSQIPRMPVVEADWFVSEPMKPEAASFSIASRVYSGKPLDDLCRTLTAGGLGAVISRSHAALKAVEGALVIESKDAMATLNEREGRTGVEVKPPDPRPPEKLPPIPYQEGEKLGPGTIVQPGLVAKETRATERRDVTPKDPDPDNPVDPEVAAQDDAERRGLDAARDVLVRQARAIRVTAGDLVDVPAARRALARLTELDPEGLPKGLPSEFVLASTGAPKDYVTALAIETLTDDESPDRLAALRWLGDQPSPDAIEDLLIVLRRRPDAKPVQLEQALALRALLKAAPDQARMQALRLLTGPRRVVRAAMGVYWFTEPPLRRELAATDFTNVDKVRAMAARIRSYLTVSARDPDLKKAAAGVQNP